MYIALDHSLPALCRQRRRRCCCCCWFLLVSAGFPSPLLQLSDPSLLRFLVDMRGADPDDKQLRDDLMTMLIAGGAAGTWHAFNAIHNAMECLIVALVPQDVSQTVAGDPLFKRARHVIMAGIALRSCMSN
jgi:hypothetical protein